MRHLDFHINLSLFQRLRDHVKTCKGKFIYTCPYCEDRFVEREKFTNHLIQQHKPKTDFKTTNVFVGDSSHKVKTYDNSVPKSSERSLVILTPGLTTTDEIFTPDLRCEMRKLMEWDLGIFSFK